MTIDNEPRFKKLQGQQKYFVSYPKIQSMMCGVIQAWQDKDGDITVVYSDGQEEIAPCEKEIQSFKSLNSIVSYVQSFRKQEVK